MSEPQKKKEIAEDFAIAVSEGSETASNEAQKGMGQLLNDRQKLIEFLKAGGKSGITNDFGKPSIVNAGEPGAHPCVAADNVTIEPGETAETAAPNKLATSGVEPTPTSEHERAKRYRLKHRQHEELLEIQRVLEIPEPVAANLEPTTLVSRQPIDRRFFTGVEVALVVLVASAGVARRHPDKRPAGLSEREDGQAEAAETGEDTAREMAMLVRNDTGAATNYEPPQERRRKALRRPQMIVSASDTLTGLAEALYHEPDLGWLIADLNRHNTKESKVEGKRVVELRSRQLLEIPIWEDISEFYSSRPKEAKAENLVTIVVHAEIDREELIAALGRVMGTSDLAFPDLTLAASVERFVGRKVKWS
jgi:hypothetical protein